ncbi:MAG: bifunctional ADP-dependent NAD(P)H-hydrate dehydratase/NAD(P)H-hydrate epimerase [Xanthomonadales bacterium]|nr:bifunctional ADP-dependent NAD(P)H-hydrate dehydratase/NAD(P)H-hydrate epimerase [Ahrensia sp.]MBL38262.1 bifunctional ADP-dependent NAD(P)H-hydrate dehydratase/NAD(P)H-hydrate epimerase [Xanthomonadales bacterium]
MDIDSRLYRADQVRELDRRAIAGNAEDRGIAGFELMQRAGAAVFRAVRARFPEAKSLVACCGGGNNGGDGYVVASLARRAGLQVRVIAMKAPAELDGDARRAADAWLDAGGPVSEPDGQIEADVIVDALLGTGLDREVRDDYAALIESMNASDAAVVAVDVPSGLQADTGMPLGTAVRADATVSFIGRKRGLETGRAPDFTGAVLFDDLDVPDSAYRDLDPDAVRLSDTAVQEFLPPRMRAVHKGALGHPLVCGGDFNMPGAVLLAARAALVTGSGLVSVATRREHSMALAGSLPEAMWADGESGDTLDALAARTDVIALGPGLGTSDWSREAWRRLLGRDLPVVLDADGLNLLAEHGFDRENWILTPHPGEAGRLLEVSTADVQRDRFAAARELAERFRAVVVLKGAGSLVADPDGRVALCPFGNPAMATAGMGDALTGIIASLVGQGGRREGMLFDAACAGVVVHARAGDVAAEGRRAILAGELIAAVPRVLPGTPRP